MISSELVLLVSSSSSKKVAVRKVGRLEKAAHGWISGICATREK